MAHAPAAAWLQSPFHRAPLIRSAVAFGALLSTLLGVSAPVTASDDPWPSIRKDVFQERPLHEDSGAVQIFAPNQADDAAIVPVTVRIPSNYAATAKSLTLLIDRNPAPVAATFAFGDGFRSTPDIGERMLSTRVRVDAFSRVRAILETTDGKLHMTSKFVIGSGGCSAPASKDPDEAVAQLGKTQLKVFKNESHGPNWREAQVMVRHPNFTGMQMNKKTGQFTPARFVNFLEVKQGEQLLFRMEGGISISEDPNIRFTYGTSKEADLDFVAKDTDGIIFKGSSLGDPS